jgi:hypothetical protein
VYRYLAPGGRILRFPHSGALQLRLDSDGAAGAAPLPQPEWGTVIKLWDYQLPGGAKTNIVFDLFNHLSCLMPGIAVPVRFYERRLYRGHTLESTLVGLSARLDRDTHDNLEFVPTSHVIDVDDCELTVKVYAFGLKSDGKSASEKFRDREGIIFLVNGQSHGAIDKAFFRRKRVNLSYIADDILVLCDASSIPGRAREDLFMNSRDRLRDGPLRRKLESELEKLLSQHALLKALQNRRREEALARKLADDKALEEVLADIIKRSPSLAALFLAGKRLADPFRSKEGTEDPLSFKGERFPTYFRLMKNQARGTAHLGQRFKVFFETDAENQFFARDLEPGIFELELNGEPYPVRHPNLLNGVATLNLTLPAGASAGQTLHWQGAVSDSNRLDPFEFDFERTVGPEVDPSTGRGERRPPAKPGAGEREVPQGLTLPPITSVYQKDWGRFGFDRESALATRRSSEGGWDFYVNMDNVHLRWEAKAAPAAAATLEARFRYALALVGLALLKATDGRDSADEEEESPEAFVETVTKAIAPVLLPMIAGLAELDDAAVSEADDEADHGEDPNESDE